MNNDMKMVDVDLLASNHNDIQRQLIIVESQSKTPYESSGENTSNVIGPGNKTLVSLPDGKMVYLSEIQAFHNQALRQ